MSGKTTMDDLLNAEGESDDKTLPLEPEVTPEAAPPIAQVRTPSATQPTKIRDFRARRIAENEKLYQSLGISKKYAPPLTRKRSAIYQLVNFKGTVDNRLTDKDKYVDPPYWGLVPSYTFVDYEESDLTRREKTMTYYEGGAEVVYIDDPVTKKKVPQSIPKIGTPELIQGQAVVSIYGAYGRYAWWELHPQNASNKWRNKSMSPIFERIDTKYESPHVANIKQDLKVDATKYVLDMKPNELMNLAAALTNPTVNTNVNPEELKLALRMRAWDRPDEILYTAPNNQGASKVAIIHALDLGILTFVPEHESYYYGQDEIPLYTVPTGNSPFESLVKFLSGEKASAELEQIKNDLAFWF